VNGTTTTAAEATGLAAAAGPYGLDRLSFQLPEFQRVSWVSDRAREVWEPRIRRIFQAWMEIEVLAVVDGVRECGVSSVAAERLPEVAGRHARRDLSTLPLAILGAANYSYQNAATAPVYGQPFQYRVVVGTPANVARLQAAWDACDQETIGALLGYPSCCRRFFHDVWVEHDLRDTTWPMAAAASDVEGPRLREVEGPFAANILWRWTGVRAVSHLPCRFDCEATAQLGERLLAVGRSHGFADEMGWIEEILQWPVEWSCLHGIAEVKTPILKLVTSTDATASKYVVRRKGNRYPAEGARGLSFAFRLPHPPRLTGSRRFRDGLANPLSILDQPGDER
jgi:hypothetical protein